MRNKASTKNAGNALFDLTSDCYLECSLISNLFSYTKTCLFFFLKKIFITALKLTQSFLRE